jgi:hypothetical protein
VASGGELDCTSISARRNGIFTFEQRVFSIPKLIQSFRIQVCQRPSGGIGHVGVVEDTDVDKVARWSLEMVAMASVQSRDRFF